MKRTTKRGHSSNLRRSLTIWLIHHAQAFIFSLGQMSKNPVGSFFTTAVIGISLSLPAGFYLLLDNTQRLTDTWDGAMQINLFLKYNVSGENASSLVQTLQNHADIEEVKFIDRDEALEEYRNNSGFADALSSLEDNPLPIVLLLQPAEKAIASVESNKLLDYLHSLEEVESAQLDRQWASRLFAIIDLFQRAVIILSTLLAFAVLLIVGNTIRLSIYNRRSEIEINQLFGATDGFIQRPFMYSGLIHGVAGSIMAWLLIFTSLKLLQPPVLHLSSLYQSDFHLENLNAAESLILILAGACLGLIGSWIAVQRHIKSIGLS